MSKEKENPSSILRFTLGLGFGVVLTVYAFAFAGVGHGIDVPLVFAAPFLVLVTNLGALPALVLAPLLWALYFLLMPRIQRRRWRIITTLAILFCHVLPGLWLALTDPAFARALNEERRGLAIFALLFGIALSSLFFLATRGVFKVKP